MDAKDAIATAKQYVADLFGEEGIINMGLEELSYDLDIWEVTIGFSRPWNVKRDALSAVTGTTVLKRSFKELKISDADKRLIEIRDKDIRDA